MASDINALYTKKYTDVLRLNAQQEMSRFRAGCLTQSCSGEHANIVDFVGKSTIAQRTTRGEAKVIADKDHTRRWVESIPYASESDIVDSLDMLRTMVDPTGRYSASQLAAMNRRIDDDIITALFGTAKTGKSGTTSTSFDSNNVVAAGAANFTIGKVLDAIKLLEENEVILEGNEELFMALSPDQKQKFVQFDEVKNKDYGNTYFDGSSFVINGWMGINIITTNRLTKADGTFGTAGGEADREIPLWAKSGMTMGIWEDVNGTVTQSNDRKNEPMLITTYADYGITRTEEEKVIKIIVDETA